MDKANVQTQIEKFRAKVDERLKTGRVDHAKEQLAKLLFWLDVDDLAQTFADERYVRVNQYGEIIIREPGPDGFTATIALNHPKDHPGRVAEAYARLVNGESLDPIVNAEQAAIDQEDDSPTVKQRRSEIRGLFDIIQYGGAGARDEAMPQIKTKMEAIEYLRREGR